jgi:putative endonuclease
VYYVYILRSKKDRQFYIGYTGNLTKRVELHNKGRIESTKYRKPFQLVYYEVCINKEDALHREKYLKTTYGNRYIRNRIKHYLEVF